MDENISIPVATANLGFQQAVSNIDSNNDKIKELSAIISRLQEQVDSLNSQVADINANTLEFKQNITQLALMEVPLQAAVDLLNAKPEYGINWTPQA